MLSIQSQSHFAHRHSLTGPIWHVGGYSSSREKLHPPPSLQNLLCRHGTVLTACCAVCTSLPCLLMWYPEGQQGRSKETKMVVKTDIFCKQVGDLEL